MIAIDEMFRQPMAQAVGWALLQFLWQGTLIAVLTALLLRLLQRSAADVRYVISAVAMALMLTMPVVTAIQAYVSIGQGLKTSEVSRSWLPPSGGSSAPAAAFRPFDELRAVPSSVEGRLKPEATGSINSQGLQTPPLSTQDPQNPPTIGRG